MVVLQFTVDSLIFVAFHTLAILMVLNSLFSDYALPNVTVIAIYRPPQISLTALCQSLIEVLRHISSESVIIIGDFNVNWVNEVERRPLYNLLIREKNYKQLISHYTTDNRTIIDHIYTNIPDLYTTSGVLETYFTDHKAIWVSLPYKSPY